MSGIRMTKNGPGVVGTTITTTKGDEGIVTETRNLMRNARNAESEGEKRRPKRKRKNVAESERKGRGSANERGKEVETDPRMKARGADTGHDVKDPFLGILTDLSGRIDLTGLLQGMLIWIVNA